MEHDEILKNLLGRDEYLVVGRSVVRTDAIDKALGRARFTADYVPKGTAVVKVLRSSQPHALIKHVDVEAALRVLGVLAVLTADDVPGHNQIGYALPDQPFLNGEKVHYIGDPIALICAEDEYSAVEGMDARATDL